MIAVGIMMITVKIMVHRTKRNDRIEFGLMSCTLESYRICFLQKHHPPFPSPHMAFQLSKQASEPPPLFFNKYKQNVWHLRTCYT